MAGTFSVAFLQHLHQAVHAGGGFFGDAVDFLQHLRIFLMHDPVRSPPSSRIMLASQGLPSFRMVCSSTTVFFFGLAFPGKHGECRRGDGGGGVVLRGENIAGGPAHFRAQCTSVSISTAVWMVMWMQPMIFAPASGFCGGVFAAQAHQGGHFGFGEDDFLAAPVGQGNIGNFVVEGRGPSLAERLSVAALLGRVILLLKSGLAHIRAASVGILRGSGRPPSGP
jgi:hypothetical protein